MPDGEPPSGPAAGRSPGEGRSTRPARRPCRDRDATKVHRSQPERHIAGTTTRLILAHVRGRTGPRGVEAVVTAAGDPRTARTIADEATWSSYDQTIALFEAAAKVLDDPDVGLRIGAEALAYAESSPL